MKIARLLLAASACSLFMYFAGDVRADDSFERKHAKLPSRTVYATGTRLGAPSPRRALKWPAFLRVGAGRSPAMFSRFAVPPQRIAPPCTARCKDPRALNEALARMSGALTGVAAAAVAAGLVVIVARPAKLDRGAAKAELRLRLSGESAIAGVRWKF
jgi:hypothetical protein